MRIGSLCTGYGGLDAAVQTVTGGTLAWVSDIEPGPARLLEERHPGVPNLGDFTAVDWTTVEPVDVLVAGYPCQPYSAAGKRKGNEDERAIFPSVVRAIRSLGPELVFLENVRGHLSRGFDTVLGALADIGYDAAWSCVRASDTGAPHRRERLFIVAWPAAGNADRGDPHRRGAAGLEGEAGPPAGREGSPADTGGPAVTRWGPGLREDVQAA